MKSKLTTLAASFILNGLIAAAPVLSADAFPLPPERAQGEVSFITGGIGDDEATAFKNAAPTYPLELLFVQKARPTDEYLADVKVTIRDRSGKLWLDTTAEGPFLLAKLPAGKYQIEADYDGERKRQSVEIRAGKHQRAVFVWAPHDESEEPVLSSTN